MIEGNFDDMTDVYEALTNWPKRLENETPFFRKWFDHAKAKRVADVACGVGYHSKMFHSWSLEVLGVDANPLMLQRAREVQGDAPGMTWVEGRYEEPFAEPASVDVAVCIGNSLALAIDGATAGRAAKQMLDAVRPGGVCIVSVLNLWRLPDGPCVWQKIIRAKLKQGSSLIVKGVHRCGDRGYIEVVVGVEEDATPVLRSHSVPFLGLTADTLKDAATQAGAHEVKFFGGYKDQPYDPATSTDLIMVALKG